MKIKRTLYYYYLRLKRLQGNPRVLAQGAAIGAAIGITPTLPFHTVMILATTFLLRVNPVSAIIAGTIVSNPLTFVPQYYVSWWIGDKLLPGRLTWKQIEELLVLLETKGFMDNLRTICEIGLNTTLVLAVGGIILAIPTGIIFYIVSLKFFVSVHRRRREKHLLNNS